jgi:hypothetical protein
MITLPNNAPLHGSKRYAPNIALPDVRRGLDPRIHLLFRKDELPGRARQ